MTKDNKIIVEAPERDDDTSADTKRAVLSLIASNLYRFGGSTDDTDTKGLLMLVAALSILNLEDQPNAVQVARRLSQLALVRLGRTKKDK